MPLSGQGWIVTPAELESWILLHTPEILVVNKPAFVVCHPSKRGLWSSLVGACREYTGVDRLHMPSRLDRETSGVVVLAKTQEAGSRLQRAALRRRVRKTYWAILAGALDQPTTVDASIGPEPEAEYYFRQRVAPTDQGGRAATTGFVPIATTPQWTLARVYPLTGRLHQIRVHAAHIGHSVAGDKLYPDVAPMMEFIRNGFSERLSTLTPLPRHALHAAEIQFETERGTETFRAPLTPDLAAFCRDRMGVEPPDHHSL